MFKPYFAEWLVEKYFSWWTPFVLCAGAATLAWWWLS